FVAPATGEQESISEPIGNRGLVELLLYLRNRDVAVDGDERFRYPQRRMLGQRPQHFGTVPGVADNPTDDIALGLHAVERRRELALVEHEAFVVDAGIEQHLCTGLLVGPEARIADCVQDTLARTNAAGDIVFGPAGIGELNDPADMLSSGA